MNEALIINTLRVHITEHDLSTNASLAWVSVIGSGSDFEFCLGLEIGNLHVLGSAHPHYNRAWARLVTGWPAQLAPLVYWGR